MAFKTPTNSPATATQDTAWKADGYLNASLPLKNGGVASAGAIILRKSDPIQAKMIELIESLGVEHVTGKLVFTYQPANARASKADELDL